MKPKSFGDYWPDASNWITLASGEYYPDILPDACELYRPVLVLFGQILQRSESSTHLFLNLCEIRETWMRIQLARASGVGTIDARLVGVLSMATGVTSKKRKEDAPFRLDYAGKLPERDVLQLPAVEPTSWPVELFCESGELFQGDNLGAMLWLLKTKSLRHKVRCVYIDPPYATAQAFVDRDANHAYEDVLNGAHYIESLRRRLIVLRELLANDGSIFVHLDQTMIFEIKLVMDEVFGRSQFRNFITRKKCNTKNYTRNQFGNIARASAHRGLSE